MKFLALIYADENGWAELDDGAREEIIGRYRAFSDEVGATGKLAGGAETQPTSAATTVRVRGGETLVSDGPFVETKEQIGGFFVFDCESLDDAVALAARIPGAQGGAVEVRPAHVEEDEG